mgnify:FL=1
MSTRNDFDTAIVVLSVIRARAQATACTEYPSAYHLWLAAHELCSAEHDSWRALYCLNHMNAANCALARHNAASLLRLAFLYAM